MATVQWPDYLRFMINQKQIIKTNSAGFVLGALLLTALANGAISANAQSIITVTPPSIVVTPPVVVAPPVVQDEYIYYPAYGIYYNSGRHQYAYLNNGAWTTAATPYGVTADVLLTSPSVRMDWHDSPEKHHADMMQRYPKNWKSGNEHHDQKDDSKRDSDDRKK
jgi:hypothetical protein